MSDQLKPWLTAAEPAVFDPFTPGFAANPYSRRRLRAGDPVHRSAQGYWVLTRYDDGAAVLRGPRLFGVGETRPFLQKRLVSGAAFGYASRQPSNYDPPDHTRLRS